MGRWLPTGFSDARRRTARLASGMSTGSAIPNRVNVCDDDTRHCDDDRRAIWTDKNSPNGGVNPFAARATILDPPRGRSR